MTTMRGATKSGTPLTRDEYCEARPALDALEAARDDVEHIDSRMGKLIEKIKIQFLACDTSLE
jgi:hypothetical protein